MKRIMTWLRAMRDYITRPYYNLRDYLRYREAVEIADAAHEKDSDRYYVMPSMDGKLIIVDRKNFRLLKRKGYISKTATMGSTITECFYFTPNIQRIPISEEWRRKKYDQYKKWCKAMRMMNRVTNK